MEFAISFLSNKTSSFFFSTDLSSRWCLDACPSSLFLPVFGHLNDSMSYVTLPPPTHIPGNQASYSASICRVVLLNPPICLRPPLVLTLIDLFLDSLSPLRNYSFCLQTDLLRSSCPSFPRFMIFSFCERYLLFSVSFCSAPTFLPPRYISPILTPADCPSLSSSIPLLFFVCCISIGPLRVRESLFGMFFYLRPLFSFI